MSRWDQHIRWQSIRITEPTALPLTVPYVRDEVLRVANGTVEDTHIERLIRAATSMAELDTDRALMPQTWRMTLSGFPAGPIVLPRPPLIEVDSVAYVDTAGDTQALTGSPPEYRLKPSGLWSRAELWPIENTAWPSTASVPNAVVIEFQCGFAVTASSEPPDVTVFSDILVGIELAVAELYKQRSLSVHAVHNTKSVLQTDRFWRQVP